jgi:diguanylate cyclase (GGDEF)-like protein/PAS domain S-box-containing protein
MRRIPPILQIALALVFLSSALLIIADLLFGVFVPPQAARDAQRKAFGESLAVQSAAILRAGDRRALEAALQGVHRHDPAIRSLAVRRADRSIVAQAGDHAHAWSEPAAVSATTTRLEVPLLKGSERWGSFEMTFVPDSRSPLRRALDHPLWITLLFAATAGAAVYWIYLRRALIHLDPTAVIPERVRLAFDVMAEGVAVLDRAGRILLANRALRALAGNDATDPTGKPLAALPWLAPGLTGASGDLPWIRAMREGGPVTGYSVEIRAPAAARKLSVNCAPVLDTQGSVRGCLVTFDDLTELHLANERLFQTLAELSASKEEIQRKNTELEHLATHDPLSGCLSRRAFFARMEHARAEARRGSALSCFVLDIDHFKSINDTYGHVIGDRVIQEVGAQLRAFLRATDVIARFGGDEFLAGMPGCELDEATAVARKIAQAIAARFGPGTQGPRVTVSIGVAALERDDTALTDLIQMADQALYRAKSLGRNRVAKAA